MAGYRVGRITVTYHSDPEPNSVATVENMALFRADGIEYRRSGLPILARTAAREVAVFTGGVQSVRIRFPGEDGPMTQEIPFDVVRADFSFANLTAPGTITIRTPEGEIAASANFSPELDGRATVSIQSNLTIWVIVGVVALAALARFRSRR